MLNCLLGWLLLSLKYWRGLKALEGSLKSKNNTVIITFKSLRNKVAKGMCAGKVHHSRELLPVFLANSCCDLSGLEQLFVIIESAFIVVMYGFNIFSCVHCGHNLSLTTCGGGLADRITICSQCV